MEDARVGDDVAGRVRFGGARLGGDLAVADFVDDGVVEDGGGVAEDEVDAAGDVAVDVVLAAVVGEECVLIAEEAAVLEDGAVGADGSGDGLRTRSTALRASTRSLARSNALAACSSGEAVPCTRSPIWTAPNRGRASEIDSWSRRTAFSCSAVIDRRSSRRANTSSRRCGASEIAETRVSPGCAWMTRMTSTRLARSAFTLSAAASSSALFRSRAAGSNGLALGLLVMHPSPSGRDRFAQPWR